MHPRKLILAPSAVIQALALDQLERRVNSDITIVTFAGRRGRNRKARVALATRSPKLPFKLHKRTIDFVLNPEILVLKVPSLVMPKKNQRSKSRRRQRKKNKARKRAHNSRKPSRKR